DADRHVCRETLVNVLRDHPAFSEIALFERDGSLVCGSEPGGGLLAHQALVNRHSADPSLVFLRSAHPDRVSFAVSFPVDSGSREAGRVLAASGELSGLDQARARLGLSGAALASFVDVDGRILAQTGASSAAIASARPIDLRQPFSEGPDAAGVMRVSVAAPIETELGANLWLVAGMARDEIYADADAAMRRNLWMLGLALGAAIIAV